MEIRRARAQDAPALARLSRACGREAWSEDAFSDAAHRPDCQVWVAGAEARAYAVVRVAADEAELHSFAVSPPVRRRGLGGDLLRHALAAARAAGARSIHLEVSASNRAARRLYAAAGFRVRGRRPRFYANGEDALRMERRLDATRAA